MKISKEFIDAVQKNIVTGRIAEIYDFAKEYFKKEASELPDETKAALLCTAMNISVDALDKIIAGHSEVSRTIKGHAFEVVFDTMMEHNNIHCKEIGGDTDVDREINNKSLQLKTQYAAGCSETVVSYKTHKTHGAKSQEESVDYYHKVSDFAEFLVGLVSYHPFKVLIIPKEALPRVPQHNEYIISPMYIDIEENHYINNFEQLGVLDNLDFPENLLVRGDTELLKESSKLLDLRSDYILRAIFIKDNFRIWDMNMRGFIREYALTEMLRKSGIKSYPPAVTRLERADKCDIVLKLQNDEYVRYQVKGLTWGGCKLDGKNTRIDCETQLSRGRVNDHPTQSRLYKSTDFEALFIAIDPPYSNALSMAATGTPDFNWRFYCVPQRELSKHHVYNRRVASHQYINYLELQQYLVTEDLLKKFKREA